MNGGPSGFQNAPVTRTFVIATALLTILLGIKGRSVKLGLSYEEIFQNFHLWRLIASLFTFSSTPELIFGLYLLAYFRVFERQIGSNKYSVFILFSILASLLFQLLSLAYFKDPSLSRLAPGPYGLIFASFIPFYFDIPVSSRFRICGIRLTDKSFIYFAGLQLLFSFWKRSLVPGLCGLLSGSLYRLNLFRIRKIKFPDFVASFFLRLSSPSSRILPNIVSNANSTRNIPSHLVQQTEEHNPSTLTSSAEPSEAFVAQLVMMGFDRSSAMQALLQARNDIGLASNILLEAQSH